MKTYSIFGRRDTPHSSVIAANRALRGNTARVCEHIGNGKSKVGLHRREIIKHARQDRRETREEIAQIIADARAKASGRDKPYLRVASIKANHAKGEKGFRVAGIGLVPQVTLNEIKTFLGVRGFTGFRLHRSGKRDLTGELIGAIKTA